MQINHQTDNCYGFSRSRLGVAYLLSVVLAFATHAVQAQISQGNLQVRLQTTVAFSPTFPGGGNFELTPTDLIPLDDGTGRNLLATLGGTIRVIDGSDNLLVTPLLTTGQTGLQLQQESGMTGIAVHPDFSTPDTFGFGKLYTITTENGSGSGGLDNGNVDFPVSGDVHQDVIREWDLSAISGNPNVNSLPAASLASSREIIRIDQPGPYHDVYDLTFSPHDHLLYISSGDGGIIRSEAQDLGSIYGNILRIDPNPNAHSLVRTSANTGLAAYSIPADNPYNGDDASESKIASTLAEIWANGIRSPYRISFDRQTADLYEGDVGSNQWEEINLIEKGQNYGWPNREGTSGSPPPGGSIDPLFQYGRDEGRTIVGGFVYRGSAMPRLQGKYIFADFGQGRDHARLFYGIVDPSDLDGNVGDIFDFTIDAAGSVFPIDTNGDFTPDVFTSLLPDRIFSIGEDENGELYLVAGQDPRGFAPSVPGAFVVKLAPLPVVPGDFDGNRIVNALDLAQWRDDYGISGDSDTDGDGDSDGRDFLIWQQNFATEAALSESTAVPEPAAALLLVIGLLFLDLDFLRIDGQLAAHPHRCR